METSTVGNLTHPHIEKPFATDPACPSAGCRLCFCFQSLFTSVRSCAAAGLVEFPQLMLCHDFFTTQVVLGYLLAKSRWSDHENQLITVWVWASPLTLLCTFPFLVDPKCGEMIILLLDMFNTSSFLACKCLLARCPALVRRMDLSF